MHFRTKETVNYFRKNKSNVYVMILDATKAFDKVNYVKLFYQLIDRGLNPFNIRCLLYMYRPTRRCLNVSWNNSQSKYFPTTNGVKQGGVLLSQILFSVYIDELLTRLKHSGYGCMVGHVYCGAFAYADDMGKAHKNCIIGQKFCLHHITGTAFIIRLTLVSENI